VPTNTEAPPKAVSTNTSTEDVIETDETMDVADSTLLISAEPGVFENEGIVKYCEKQLTISNSNDRSTNWATDKRQRHTVQLIECPTP